MSLDTSLPPAMFDLDEIAPVIEQDKTQRELHEGLGGTIGSWVRAGYCGSARWDWHPDPQTGWYGAHVCTLKPFHTGDCKCDRCPRTWNHDFTRDGGIA